MFLGSLRCGKVQFLPSAHSVADPLFTFFTVQGFLLVERSPFYHVYFSVQTIYI